MTEGVKECFSKGAETQRVRRNELARLGRRAPGGGCGGTLYGDPNSLPYSRLKDQCGRDLASSEDIHDGRHRPGSAPCDPEGPLQRDAIGSCCFEQGPARSYVYSLKITGYCVESGS